MSDNKYCNETEFIFSDEFIGFTTIPNTILNDKRISFKALGIYIQILQYQNSKEHKIYIKSLQSAKKDGRDSVAAGINELINAGYLTREQITNEKGHLCGIKYRVYMKPCVSSTSTENGKPVNGKPDNGKPVTYNKNSKKENTKKENNTTDPVKALKSAVVPPQEEIIVKETNIKTLSSAQRKEVSTWDIYKLTEAIEIYKELGGLYFKLLHKIYKEGAKRSLTGGKIEANKGMYTHDWDFDELEKKQRERIKTIIKKE